MTVQLNWPVQPLWADARLAFEAALLAFRSANDAPTDPQEETHESDLTLGNAETLQDLAEEQTRPQIGASNSADSSQDEHRADDEGPDEPDWKPVQRAAPEFVRENLWLTVAWAKWCIREEEPRLYWLAVGAGAFVLGSWGYELIRAVMRAAFGA